MEHTEWTVEGAASELDLAVSTAYRYFRSLSKAGLIVAVATGRYVLGPAIIQYDRQIRLRDPLTTAAQPVMKRLTEQILPHSVVLLCRLFRNQVMCVHQESAERPEFATSYERGRAMPLFRGASSKVILAHLPSRTVKGLYAELPAQFAQASLGRSWDEAKERLRTLRNTGFSITQGDLDPGMCGIAVPVFEPPESVVGSLSIVIPARHLTPKFLEEAPRVLKEAADQIRWALSLGVQESESARRAVPAPRHTAPAESKARRRPRGAKDGAAGRKGLRRARA